MVRRLLVVLVCVCAFAACSKPADPPPAPPAAPPPAPPPTITQATFEPVYRASKAIQGATGPGVTYVKFGELLQGLSTEISIAKDHQLNDLDKQLIGLYEEALAAYKFSAALWNLKNEANRDHWKGEIPVAFKGQPAPPEIAVGLASYGLVPENRSFPTGDKYEALPATAIQTVWLKADDILKRATEMYYGRSQPQATAK